MTFDDKAIKLLGNTSSGNIFIQLVDEHDEAMLQNEAEQINKIGGTDDWCLASIKTENWNDDLSPWQTDAVFGKQGFGGGARLTLDGVLNIVEKLKTSLPAAVKKFFIVGYSLAGLFALWAAYQTNVFCGVAAVSPSVWFDGWTDYSSQNEIKTKAVYLSLGDKEEKTKNPRMARVGDAIRTQYDVLSGAEVRCKLEWNSGNHFVESDRRVAKGVCWLIDVIK
ncbi:MAG: esterase [Clostridia bacterium]|nr:esterase [Clostridia bacterium]